MIPILYSADNTDFTSQGLGLISEVIKCHVSEQRNANYFLEIEVPVFSKRFKELKLERLIKVDDHNNTGQLFRIKSIGIPSQGMCSIYAEHISKDIEGYTINPEVQVSGPANQALEIWRKNLLEKDKVTVYSDITTSTPIRRWTIDEMENPMYCLGGKSGSILQLYKGEYQFDNLNIKLHQSRGFNTGASITYGRNMNDFSQDESIEEVANSIYPFAWKDEEGKENEDRQMIVLKNLYYDGPHIDKYAERRVFFVDFTDKKPKDVKELEKLATKYVKDNNVGAPKVSMTVNPILNGNLTEGLELNNFEQVNLCDIVTVKFDKLKINVQAKVNEVTYDVLNEKFVSYHLGDERRTLSNSLGKIETSVNNVGKEIQKVTGWAQQSADGKNTIFYGKEEPKAHKKGDTWFKETPNGIVINVWDGQIWLEVKTDFSEEFDKLDKELDVQKEKIEQSLNESQKAIEEAGFSKHSADEANKKAEQAIKEAGFSKGLSESTQKELINSQKELTIVKNSADKAIQDAEKALNTIENIEIGGRNYFLNSSKLDQTNILPYSGSKLHLVTQNVEVSEWNTKTATNFQFTTTPINQIGVLIVGRNILYPERHYGEEFITSTYILNNGTVPFIISDNAGGNLVIPPKIPMRAIIKNPKATVGVGYQINITAQTTGINFTIWHPKMEVGNKPTDYSPAPEDAELEIMKINGELTSKASQKDIDKLNQTVTNHEVSIKQNAKELEAKADNSIVDTINKTVKNQSSQIKLNSDALKLKAEKSYVDQKNSELDSKVSSEFTVQAGKISANSKDITEQGTKLGKLESSADKMVSELTELKNQEIGGRNYFPYTYTTGVENISSWSTPMILNKELNKTKLIPGETYRIRYSYRQEEDPTPYVPFSQNGHGTLLLYSGVEGHPNVYLGGLENNAEDAKTWKKGTIRTRQAVFTMPKDISMPTQYRIISYTFRAMKKDNPSTFVKNLTGTFFDIKIEKGDKYTDWSPAPEDNIEKLSKIEQTIDGIQTTVKDKANQSQVTQLSGQITSVVKDVEGNSTQINQNKNQIQEVVKSTDGKFVEVNKTIDGIQTTVEDKADKSQVTQLAGQVTSVVKNNGVPNLITNSSMINRDYNGWDLGPSWYMSTVIRDGNGYLSVNSTENSITRAINQYIEIKRGSKLSLSVESVVERDGGGKFYVSIVFYDKDKKYIDETTLDIKASKISVYETFNLDGVVVIDGAKYIRVIALAKGDVWGCFGKPMLSHSDVAIPYTPSDVSQSQITQTKEMINMKVSKGETMSQINIDAKNILFESDKLVFDAKTTVIKGKSWMDGAVIKDASIKTAQIGDAAITNAKIGNIDAGKITAGTLSGVNINLQKTQTISENGRIVGSFDYGDPYDKSYNTRWFEGEFIFGRQSIVYTGDVFKVTPNNKKGERLYYATVEYGLDKIKMREYANFTAAQNAVAKSHIDISRGTIVLGGNFDTQIMLSGYNGRAEFQTGMFRTGLSVGTDENNRGLQTASISAPNNRQTLQLNYGRDLGKIELSKDGVGNYIRSYTIWQRKYVAGDGRVVITSEGILGTASTLSYNTPSPMMARSNIGLVNAKKSLLQLDPVNINARARMSGANVTYSAKQLEDLGLSDICYKNKDGNLIDMKLEKFIVLQNELIKELYSKVEYLEGRIS